MHRDARHRDGGAPQRQWHRRPLILGWLGVAVLLGATLLIAATGSSHPRASGSRSTAIERSASRSSPGLSNGKPVDPAVFAAGSCIVYQPTSGNRHLTVFLDAGHGGRDPGSVGTTRAGTKIYEADLTLPVELDAMRMLRAKGFTVVVSRTRNSSVARLKPVDISGNELSVQGVHDDVAARAVCANDAHAKILIGIYFDAGAPNNAGSVTGYDAVRPFAAANLRLARLVQNSVLSAMNAHGWGIPNEGVQPDSQLGSAISSRAVAYGHLMLLGPASPGWFNTPSMMPGALIEPLFITDPFEGSIAASAQGQQVIAAGITRAVERYFAPSRARSGAAAP